MEKAQTKEEKDTVRGSDNQPTGEAQKKESEGTKEFTRYRIQTEDLLGELHNDIQKAWAIFGDFQDEYSFIDGMRNSRFDSGYKGNENLCVWALEYDRIMQRLDIVGDYIQKVNIALKERLKKAE